MGRSEPDLHAADFGALVDEHHAALFRFARRRMTDRAGIEDVLAETFLVAWRRRDAIPEPALPWLYGVCLRVISTHRRSLRRRLRLRGRLSSQPVGFGRDPADVYAATSEINYAFAALSENDREVLRLVAWEGLSAAEGAAVLGITPAAFRARLHRARRALAKQLEAAGHERVMNDGPDRTQPESAAP